MSTQAQIIARAISRHQKLHYRYVRDEASRQIVLRNVETIVDKYLIDHSGQTLRFVLPGFPFKFPLRTLMGRNLKQDSIADASDYFAILELESFINSLCEAYKPGVTVDILMDSEGFSELERIPGQVVAQYRKDLVQIVKKLGMGSRIGFVSYRELGGGEAFEVYQRRVSGSLEEYVERSKRYEPSNFLNRYIGVYEYQRRQLRQLLATQDALLSADLQVRKAELRNRLTKTVKESAYRNLWHQDTWRQIVAEHCPDHLRLSVHPQPLESSKIGIRLSSNSNMFAPLPWQGVPVRVMSQSVPPIDIVIDFSELEKLDHDVPLRSLYFDRIGRRLRCFVIDTTFASDLARGNSYQRMMRELYDKRTKGLVAFKS